MPMPLTQLWYADQCTTFYKQGKRLILLRSGIGSSTDLALFLMFIFMNENGSFVDKYKHYSNNCGGGGCNGNLGRTRLD